ncbi:hypothetical protein [Pelagibius marinus]|uniref:hypothetical protein n=1 Tax=Pelagibius marinus TaxID=2762760 RepID=UPI0018729762|nr:hypothetical protein [Pelagibius marinus]
MNSRRFLSAVVTASVVAAFTAPAAQAAGSEGQTPVTPMPQNRNLGHMILHMEDQKADHIAAEMADPMAAKQTALPGHVALPASPYEQSAQALTPTELCKRYERRFDTVAAARPRR